jgi:Rrf2 family nitric oxide-sensitive transcriptional repressor
MRMTLYADYALRLLIYLAAKDDGLATIPEVAQNYGISKNHLVKVAHRLVQEGYITGLRGAKGGLRLAHPPETVNIGEVFRRIEPDMALVPCFPPVNAPCPIVPACVLRDVLEKARSAFLKVLDGYTLADLAAPRKELRELLRIAV